MLAIAHNMAALNAYRQLGQVHTAKSKSTEKLSSGYRINRAADDAAGLAISETMRRQINGLSQGTRNCQDGISVCQIADGALSEVNDMLNRITELSVKSANGTLSPEDREHIQAEISQLTSEISRVGDTTTFNEIPIFHLPERLVEDPLGNDMSLISSPSASIGYLSEAYKVGSTYYPAASMDFSNLNKNNIPLLADKSFSFTCSQSCDEVFKFTFIDGDGTESKFLNPSSKGQKVEHDYQIDIHGLTTGSGVLNELFNCVKNNPPTIDPMGDSNSLKVSHSNILVKESSTKLIIRADSYGNTDSTKAVQDFLNAKKGTPHGQANFSEVTGLTPMKAVSSLDIQYGSEAGQLLRLEIDNMDADIIGVSDIDVRTIEGATDALGKTKKAMNIINEQRSKIGSQQNRLEHTIKNENNVVENTTASESKIRDTDISTEMVNFSNQNILEQFGSSMLAQANQNSQHILSLLS